MFADVTGVVEPERGDQSDALALHNTALYNISVWHLRMFTFR